MKKLCATLLAIAMVMLASVDATAGVFDGCHELTQVDGACVCVFSRIRVPMDEAWHRQTVVLTGDGGSTASFYHKASYDAYAAEGLTGGLLFTLGASENTDFQNLPECTWLGLDEETAMNYYAVLPTDYQAYAGDAVIQAEYDALWRGVGDVIANIQIGEGGEDSAPVEAKAAVQDRIVSSGDYDYLIEDRTAAIAGYTGNANVITIPSEINEYQVTAICPEAFRYRKFKSVSIPGSIRSIGRQAFEYCEITDALVLPAGGTIAEDAFSYAKLPATVVIPGGSTVEACAFSYCEDVKRVLVEPGCVIESRAFGYCADLGWAICADRSRLDAQAFEYCRHMEQAVLCGDVKAEDAFFNCGDLEVTVAEASGYDALRQSALDGSLGGKSGSDPVEEAERTLGILGGPATLDGVTVALDKVLAKRDPETGAFIYTFSGTLENNSDEGIMQVIYTFSLTDENGEEFHTFTEVFDGEDTAIPPHTKTGFAHDGLRWGKQSIPAAVEVSVSTVRTETELPPAHVPRPGEFLYQALGDERLANIGEEPPVALSFHVDQGGYGRTATFEAGSALDEAVERFCGIQIGAESGEWVTDNYNWIRLTWKDGSSTGISLNLSNLEYSIHSTLHTYELENLGRFWSYCADYLTEDR